MKKEALKKLNAVVKSDAKAAEAALVATKKKKDADKALHIAKKVAELAAASLSDARVICTSCAILIFL
jgi:hypothetical protein